MNTVYDLLNNLDKIDDIFNSKDYNLRGNVFEKTCALMIILNQFDKLTLLNGEEEIEDKKQYLKECKIVDGSLNGKIDIRTAYDGEYFVFFTCKFFDKEKDIDSYEVSKIISLCEVEENDNYHIGCFVRNKTEFLNKLNNSKSPDKEHIDKKFIFGLDDVMKRVNNIKTINKEIINKMLINDKSSLMLRDYQLELEKQITNKTILGCSPRTGKSYISAKNILRNNYKNVLILTPIINDTENQWKNDIFDKYIEFEDYNRIFVRSGKELLNQTFTDKNIILLSLQLLKTGDDNKLYQELSKQFKADLIIFDEQDFQGNTNKSKDIVNSLSHSNTNYLYLSGTYYKSIVNNPKFNKVIFTYNDLMKHYDDCPIPIYLTMRFEKKEYEEMKQILENISYNFSFTELFRISNKRFIHEEKIKEFINKFISGNQNKYIDNKYSVRYRINQIYRQYNQTDNKYTQLWFLPVDGINDISCNLAEILLKDSYYKDYDIICINSKNKYYYSNSIKNRRIIKSDYKTFITNKEQMIQKNINKKGLVILAGDMMQRGISLSHVNVVMYLNDSDNYSLYTQKTYRCLTNEPDKKVGIIVDFDTNRIISLCANYCDGVIDNWDIERKIKYIYDNNLLNFDTDQLRLFDFNGIQSLNNIMEIWNENPINQLNIFKKLIEEEYGNLDININNELLKCFKNIDIKNSKDIENKVKENINERFDIVDTVENQEFKKDNIITKEEYEKVVKKETDEIINKKKLSKEILPYIIPLSCVLTYDNNENKFIKCLETIRDNKTLKDIFNNQCCIIWEHNCLLDVIINIVNNLDEITSNVSINNYITKIKYNLNKLLDNPNELFEFISECIKVKHCEREKNGEVPTPVNIVNKLLDELEKVNPNIFKQKLKWFDHSAGSGIFPICLYQRLIKYHNREDIINNMIYMSEYNEKNCYIIRLIFGKNCNLHNGDTLQLNIKEKWKIDNFDVILGNPPYNFNTLSVKETNIKRISQQKGNITIWPKFIDYSFDNLKENGYLISINPYPWLKVNHKNHYMTSKKIYYLELWNYEVSNKLFNANIDLSFILLQNTNNTDKTLTHKIYRGKNNLVFGDYVLLNDKNNIPVCYDNILNKLYNLTLKYGQINYVSYNKSDFKQNNKLLSINKKDCDKTINDVVDEEYIKNHKNKNYGLETYTFKTKYIYRLLDEDRDNKKYTKLILCYKSGLKYGYIDDGNLSVVGRNNYYIVDNIDNLKILQKYLNLNFVELINQSLKFNSNFVDKIIWEFIPNILNFDEIKNIKDVNEITNEFINKLFNFTEDENKIINK